MPKFCTKCGVKLEKDSAFCMIYGAKIKEIAKPPAEEKKPAEPQKPLGIYEYNFSPNGNTCTLTSTITSYFVITLTR